MLFSRKYEGLGWPHGGAGRSGLQCGCRRIVRGGPSQGRFRPRFRVTEAPRAPRRNRSARTRWASTSAVMARVGVALASNRLRMVAGDQAGGLGVVRIAKAHEHRDRRSAAPGQCRSAGWMSVSEKRPVAARAARRPRQRDIVNIVEVQLYVLPKCAGNATRFLPLPPSRRDRRTRPPRASWCGRRGCKVRSGGMARTPDPALIPSGVVPSTVRRNLWQGPVDPEIKSPIASTATSPSRPADVADEAQTRPHLLFSSSLSPFARRASSQRVDAVLVKSAFAGRCSAPAFGAEKDMM